ncbi:sulfite exporter TauE/SafE family protein [Granulicella sibirica]|uniref:Nickel transporter UreH n=1 Tax=Granulicella sibirica TaxID=2479048 RepID=A0A4Q0TB57_9BACT|nr:sulfite exporter TauE/SafE family protein [Granulicella sibirica]RXH58881.1 Nickel transporter UreH [Granulicella sibirica]
MRIRIGFAAAVMLVAMAQVCLAHPMGNFSINHYAGIHVERDAVEVRYIVDFAEIPTYQEIQDAGIVAQVGDAFLPKYLAKQASVWGKNLTVQVNGDPVRLVAASEKVIFPPGAGGLPTMKIGVVYRGVIRTKGHGPLRLHYADGNFAGHAGWKEIVVTAGSGVTLEGKQRYMVDRSGQLTNYPTDLLSSPPQDLEAEFSYSVVGLAPMLAEKAGSVRAKAVAVVPEVASATVPVVAAPAPVLLLEANKQATPRSRFTELITTKETSLWFLITAAFFAAGLGAMHALEPGHGKTIVAAYLVGSRGRTRHAVGLGLLVTAAHTAGVYLLGAVVLYASKYVIPERIYPWLSIFSGLVIAVLAAYLFLRAWTGLSEPEEHAEGVLHTHWYSVRRDPVTETAASPADEKTVPLKQLIVLGITGGIIPCPAALVVLLSAVSLHRVGLGLFLIVAFSLGLAAVLIGIGILMVRARGLLSRWRSDAPWMHRWLPLASSSAMFLAGLAIAGAAIPAIGSSGNLFARIETLAHEHLASFAAIVGLGLFLGMRHSTDPDHVVAVSTIVSRERSVGQGAFIGMMWGLGHTLTIFIVGAAIILFKLTIPPRLGLSMEMAVAAMLILLGVLNLTGVLQRLTERFAPASWKKDSIEAPVGRGRLLERYGWFHLMRPLAIGLVHGLAGSAAVALLVLSMIRSPAWAVAYLVVFGLGTVVGMMLMTTAMAIPVALTGKKFSRSLTVVSGLASVCFGLFLVYQIGFVDGLFRSHVHWTPQ